MIKIATDEEPLRDQLRHAYAIKGSIRLVVTEEGHRIALNRVYSVPNIKWYPQGDEKPMIVVADLKETNVHDRAGGDVLPVYLS